MSTRFTWGRALVISFLLAFVAVVVALTLAWSMLPLDHTTISIDNETVRLSGIDGWHVALLIAAASAGVLIALVTGALAIVFGLLAAAFSIALALAIVIATLALVASPVLIVAWVIWRIARPSTSARPATA